MKRRRVTAASPPTSFRITAGCADFKLLAADTDGNKLRRFTMTAYTGAAMRVGFGAPVVADLAGMRVPSQSRPILRDHDTTQIVGHSTSIEIAQQRLRVAGVISGVGEAAKEVLALAGNGFPWQASIGASIDRMEFVESGSKVNVNGRTFTGPVYIARATTLGEVSFVPLGADAATKVDVAAGARGVGDMTFETWLCARGFDPATLTDQQRTTLQAAYRAEQTPPPPMAQLADPAPARPDPRLAPLTAEHATQSIAAARQRTTVQAALDAIDAVDRRVTAGEITTVGDFDLAILRAERTSGFFLGAAPRPRYADGETLAAAMLLTAGVSGRSLEATGTPQAVIDRATAQDLRGFSWHALLRAGLQAAGERIPNSFNAATIRQALRTLGRRDIMAASPSSIDVGGILSNVASKSLQSAYMDAPASWRAFAAVKSVRSFHEHTAYRPTMANDLVKLPKGGLVTHATMEEESYTYQVSTYARQFGIDRQDVVNDDLNAFATVVPGFGRAAARSLANLVFTTVLANASNFWGTGHLNYDDGSDTLLDLQGLSLAIGRLRAMKDAEGNLLDLQPAVLLVPPPLESAARAIVSSMTLSRVSTADGAPEGNPFAGLGLTVAVEPRLSDSAFSGYSPKAWYVFAKGSESVVVAFLDGAESPTIETFGFGDDVDRLAMSIRAYHDFGAALGDYRSSSKQKGEN